MSEIMENEVLSLPLLPLRGLNVFPGMLLTFDVERPASVAALGAAVKRSSLIFLSAQKDISIDAPGEEDIYRIGTVCRIRQQLLQPRHDAALLGERGNYKVNIEKILC